MADLYIQVAIPVPLRQLFTYIVPDAMHQHDVCLGERVIVPFGSRKVVGIVLALVEQASIETDKLKPILSRLDDKYRFDASLLKLLNTAANYYHHPIGEVMQQALPLALRDINQSTITPELAYLPEADKPSEETQVKMEKKSPKQASLYQIISKSHGISWPELRTLGFSKAQLNGLLTKQLIYAKPRSDERFAWSDDKLNPESKLALNDQQAVVVSAINQQQGFACHLIEGITGSGKTEVYLQIIEQVLKKHQQVLVLVPEIGLTPQTLSRFEQRFNVPIYLHHSALNNTEKLSTWLAAQNGSAAIVIGTRSAIFTPLKQLGLIIIDEEHDSSLKQQDSFRYHGRDIAILRAKQLNIPIVLGTATPSLETLQNALTGKYHHHQLTKRAGNSQLAKIELIDIAQQQVDKGLSGTLVHEIKATIARGEQVLVFINRRGFAQALTCKECHWVATCERCLKPFTLHKNDQQLVCHHCGNQHSTPHQCHPCGSVRLEGIGLGTEQVEDNLAQLFDQASIIRIDRDSTRKKGELTKMLEAINNNEHNILVGTQMLAKGHHFPNVTLVAIIGADGALFSHDFRAPEYLAQLLVQVAGRAGRASKPGKVLVQTNFPQHPLLQDLVNNGYHHFAKYALVERQQALLPPFTFQALVRAEANYPSYPLQFLSDLSTFASADCMLAGPMPAPMEKRAGKFRFHLMIQSKTRNALHRMLQQLIVNIPTITSSKKVRWSIDIDPQDLTW
ncbi:primosomal protein N' [Thalassotalea sp. LPB0316]|uniref:primosomal protein N' n=1 Tax=Thalassotalea sp. LPB0316 TaxID=2769490 RepID=UPI00186878EB|nr:primosomal protein N' [Thalassotalea sp. LPB0316]QOL25993.1 primosomal protein N' [Thalassotalea sp. LPB0316]